MRSLHAASPTGLPSSARLSGGHLGDALRRREGGLKRDLGDRILLNGAIDSHLVLIDGTPESVRDETRRILNIMAPGGGYVAGASHDYILQETPLENVLAMFDTIQEYGGTGRCS